MHGHMIVKQIILLWDVDNKVIWNKTGSMT